MDGRLLNGMRAGSTPAGGSLDRLVSFVFRSHRLDGLGLRTLTPETRVRLPLGAPPRARALGSFVDNVHPQSGRGSAWLERLFGEQEIAGSNPVVPTEIEDCVVSSATSSKSIGWRSLGDRPAAHLAPELPRSLRVGPRSPRGSARYFSSVPSRLLVRHLAINQTKWLRNPPHQHTDACPDRADLRDARRSKISSGNCHVSSETSACKTE